MSFITSICLTSSALSGDTINIYSNVDQFGTAFTSTTLSQITDPNCPVYIEVPDGTTQLLFVDADTLCSTTVDIYADLCAQCNLGLSSVSIGIGSFGVGELTASCTNNITDYNIYWYDSNDLNTPVFKTGKGFSFPYSIQHPFYIPLVQSGTYIPVIQNVLINGITFSLSGGNGTILANLNCLSGITVTDDFTCENGNTGATYSHSLSFTTQANGDLPQGISGKFVFLSADTEAFAFRFKGYDIPDNLKIIFSGSAYSDLIFLEDVDFGNIIQTDTEPTTIPKKLQSYGMEAFKKVIPLTGLTLTLNDFLIIEVNPNSGQSQTSWALDFTCTKIDCNQCLDAYKNSPYKLVTSGISISTDSCGVAKVNYEFSGCPGIQITNEWLNKYLNIMKWNIECNDSTNILQNTSWPLYFQKTACFYDNYFSDPYCVTSGNYISFNKDTSGNYNWEFSNFNDFIIHYNKFIELKTSQWVGSTNNNDIDYYRYARFWQYTGPTTITTCGDATNFRLFTIHPPTFQIFTGTSNQNFTLHIYQPLVTSGITFNDCDFNCQDSISEFLVEINGSSSRTEPPFITTVGLYNENVIWSKRILYVINSDYPYHYPFNNQNFYTYGNLTFPYSGDNVLITSLSSITCSNVNEMSDVLQSKQQQTLDYSTQLTNPNNIQDFVIYSRPFSNYGPTIGAPVELAYQFSGGQVTYTNPLYCI